MSRETERDDDLQQVLRRGDPAGDGRDPQADEIARMRATVLGAATEGRSHGFSGWVWATATTAAAAGAIAAAFFLGAGRPPEPTRREVVALPEAAVEILPIAAEPAVPGPGSPEPVPPPPPTGVPPAEVQLARQIHFTGSSGTKIIWTLDPDFDL